MGIESIKEYLPIASLAISFVSLYVTIKIFNTFHKREIQKKQIEIVLSQIHKLQVKEVLISWIKSDEKTQSRASICDGNLIKVAKEYSNIDLSKLGDKYVYLSEDLLNTIQIKEFLNNPITPPIIAKPLQKAFPESITYKRRTEANKDFILIDESRILDAKELDENFQGHEEKYYCFIHVNFKTFIQSLNTFRMNSGKWLKAQGVIDLNILWEV